MARIPYKEVLQKISVLANLGFSAVGSPSTLNADAINLLINGSTKEYWHKFWWPDLMRTEKRQFRATYANATTYAAGTEVYYPPTRKYYQCVKGATVGVTPATSTGITNITNWQDSRTSYAGDTWNSTATYAAGVIVLYAEDNLYYACHTAASAGVAPTTTNRWGVLTPFVRSITLVQTGQTSIEDVRWATPEDPRVIPWTIEEDFECVQDKVIVGGNTATPWITFRIPTYSYTGSTWNSATTYDPGDQVYYDAEGDFFISIQTGANKVPGEEPLYWTRIPYPYDLGSIVAQSVYSDLLRRDSQHDRAIVEKGEAERLLAIEIDRYSRQQRQGNSLQVKTR